MSEQTGQALPVHGVTPCPFCGGTVIAETRGHVLSWLSCLKCAADGPAGEDMEEALSNWNERA